MEADPETSTDEDEEDVCLSETDLSGLDDEADLDDCLWFQKILKNLSVYPRIMISCWF